jgi:probable rRNA maturation factor
MRTSKAKNVIVKMNFRTAKYALSRRRLEKYIRDVLAYLQVTDAEISVCFVTNPYIRTLNKQYKNRDDYTDVLAFPLHERLKDHRGREKTCLGDVIISLDQTRINAREYGTGFFDELCLYLIHGILHVLGYEDTSVRKKKIMFQLQDEIYANLGRST